MLAVARRYGSLLRTELKISGALALQYRMDFVFNGVKALFWLGITLLPLRAVFAHRAQVEGWSWPEALVVLGWFSLLKAILEGSVSPSLTAVVEGVRTGALDFVLLKPADAQFLVSTARFEPWRAVDGVGALAIIAYAFVQLGRWPRPGHVLVALVLLLVAVLLLYSLWILVVSASFWVVRVDNLSYLFGSLFDVGRWPINVFKGALRVIFTVVFPLALMTTFPAQALLGKDLPLWKAGLAVLGGVTFAAFARAVWKRAIGFYTSASS